jgi:hypothetical protein
MHGDPDATTAAYSAPVQSTPSKIVTLTGSLPTSSVSRGGADGAAHAREPERIGCFTKAAGVASTSFKLTQNQGTHSVSCMRAPTWARPPSLICQS